MILHGVPQAGTDFGDLFLLLAVFLFGVLVGLVVWLAIIAIFSTPKGDT